MSTESFVVPPVRAGGAAATPGPIWGRSASSVTSWSIPMNKYSDAFIAHLLLSCAINRGHCIDPMILMMTTMIPVLPIAVTCVRSARNSEEIVVGLID